MNDEFKKTKKSDDDELVKADEVAHHFRVDPTTVRRWARQGQLAGIYIPKQGKHRQMRFTKGSIRKVDPNF